MTTILAKDEQFTVLGLDQPFTVLPVDEQFTVVDAADQSYVIVSGTSLDSGSVDLSDYYTKAETDTLLDGKAALVHTHVVADITDFTNAFINGGSF